MMARLAFFGLLSRDSMLCLGTLRFGLSWPVVAWSNPGAGLSILHNQHTTWPTTESTHPTSEPDHVPFLLNINLTFHGSNRQHHEPTNPPTLSPTSTDPTLQGVVAAEMGHEWTRVCLAGVTLTVASPSPASSIPDKTPRFPLSPETPDAQLKPHSHLHPSSCPSLSLTSTSKKEQEQTNNGNGPDTPPD